jgi:hypothetical protein
MAGITGSVFQQDDLGRYNRIADIAAFVLYPEIIIERIGPSAGGAVEATFESLAAATVDKRIFQRSFSLVLEWRKLEMEGVWL